MALGLPPGPLMGRVLARLEDAQLEGAIQSRAEAIRWVQQRYRASLIEDRKSE